MAQPNFTASLKADALDALDTATAILRHARRTVFTNVDPTVAVV
jgi:hypothetical protein